MKLYSITSLSPNTPVQTKIFTNPISAHAYYQRNSPNTEEKIQQKTLSYSELRIPETTKTEVDITRAINILV